MGEETRAYKNGGQQEYEHTTTLRMLTFEVLFNGRNLANILSFHAVAYKFRITIDTELDPSINLHLHYGRRIIFKQCGGGLYYFDATNEAFDKYQTTYYTFLTP